MHVQTKEEIEKQKNKLKTILDLFNKLCLHSPWFIYLFSSKSHDIIFLLWSSEKLWKKVDESSGSPCLGRASESPQEPVKIQLAGPHGEFLIWSFWGVAQEFAFLKGFSLGTCWCCWCGDHTLRSTAKMRRFSFMNQTSQDSGRIRPWLLRIYLVGGHSR